MSDEKMQQNPSDFYPTNLSMAEELRRLFPESFSPPMSNSVFTNPEAKTSVEETEEKSGDTPKYFVFRLGGKDNLPEIFKYPGYRRDHSPVSRSPSPAASEDTRPCECRQRDNLPSFIDKSEETENALSPISPMSVTPISRPAPISRDLDIFNIVLVLLLVLCYIITSMPVGNQ